MFKVPKDFDIHFLNNFKSAVENAQPEYSYLGGRKFQLEFNGKKYVVPLAQILVQVLVFIVADALTVATTMFKKGKETNCEKAERLIKFHPKVYKDHEAVLRKLIEIIQQKDINSDKAYFSECKFKLFIFRIVLLVRRLFTNIFPHQLRIMFTNWILRRHLDIIYEKAPKDALIVHYIKWLSLDQKRLQRAHNAECTSIARTLNVNYKNSFFVDEKGICYPMILERLEELGLITVKQAIQKREQKINILTNLIEQLNSLRNL